jgi:hypothetical protein
MVVSTIGVNPHEPVATDGSLPGDANVAPVMVVVARSIACPGEGVAPAITSASIRGSTIAVIDPLVGVSAGTATNGSEDACGQSTGWRVVWPRPSLAGQVLPARISFRCESAV